MKKFPSLFVFCFSLLLWCSIASAIPVDLSSFSADDGVLESGGVVNFNEDEKYAAMYFFNDNFFVGNNKTNLSFDYNFQPGTFDYDDYFIFQLNYVTELTVDTNGTGHFGINLAPFQGTGVSLAWGLIWGGDNAAGTVATVSNIDLATPTPVPIAEPSTMTLLGIGLIGLLRKRKAL